MIPIKIDWLKNYCFNEIDEKIRLMEDDILYLEINDVDDLHDAVIESYCDSDRVYELMYSLLPFIINECKEYFEDALDEILINREFPYLR